MLIEYVKINWNCSAKIDASKHWTTVHGMHMS